MAPLVRRGLPLPFGAVRNRRSLVHVDDLADLIATTAVQGAPASARLVPAPTSILTADGRLAGRRHLVDQLWGSLEVDAAATVAATGWRPARGVAAGLTALGDAAQ